MLDNVRSAENVGSIYRSADCGRVEAVITCGFTPNPLSTSKLAKTAFGAESAVGTRHYDNTGDALRELKEQGVVVWALETVDGAVSYTTAPLLLWNRRAWRSSSATRSRAWTRPFLVSWTRAEIPTHGAPRTR